MLAMISLATYQTLILKVDIPQNTSMDREPLEMVVQ